MLEDIGDVDTKSTFLPWQNMAAGKMEAGFQFESAIAERELPVWCGELHRNQVVNSTETRISTIPSSHATPQLAVVIAIAWATLVPDCSAPSIYPANL
jgi:hypothetical protein